MAKIDRHEHAHTLRGVIVGLFWLACLSCAGGTDNGGMSGTGISQGAIDSFGSIFVNGVEWDTGSAQVEINGVIRPASDLRVGMVVRVTGDFGAGGTTGTAFDVVYDAIVQGPIEDDPIFVTPGGTEKSFVVLGRSIVVDEIGTAFDAGASFDTLSRDDVVQVSGFVDAAGVVRASRIESKGQFPTVVEAELEGAVANLSKNGDGTGIFDIGTVTIEYDTMTAFPGFSESALTVGDFVEVSGNLIGGGTDRIAADRIELSDVDLANENFEDAELEGYVTSFVSVGNFRVNGVAVDASGATFEPSTGILMDGSFVEVEGSLVAGVLIATRVEFEDENEDSEEVQIRAAISAIDSVGRVVTMLGVEVLFDGKTELEDERDELPNFGFGDLQVGDWLRIEGVATGVATARAKGVKRDDPGSDVVLEGPVTSLDRLPPFALAVLGQPIPIDGMTVYFDESGTPRTEDQFFSNPGDVQISDIVRVTDVEALQSNALLEADIVRIDD